MSFEIFKEIGARTHEFISVTEKNAFGLSRGFLDKHGVTADHKAVIIYDPESNRVALSFTLKDPKFGFAVRIANPKHGATIVAKSFFELKKIDAKKYARRYSDYEETTLGDLGLEPAGNKAYMITLKEAEKPVVVEPAFQSPFDDEPIDLSKIPF